MLHHKTFCFHVTRAVERKINLRSWDGKNRFNIVSHSAILKCLQVFRNYARITPRDLRKFYWTNAIRLTIRFHRKKTLRFIAFQIPVLTSIKRRYLRSSRIRKVFEKFSPPRDEQTWKSLWAIKSAKLIDTKAFSGKHENAKLRHLLNVTALKEALEFWFTRFKLFIIWGLCWAELCCRLKVVEFRKPLEFANLG